MIVAQHFSQYFTPLISMFGACMVHVWCMYGASPANLQSVQAPPLVFHVPPPPHLDLSMNPQNIKVF